MPMTKKGSKKKGKGKKIISMRKGGWMKKTGLALLHKGEKVIPAGGLINPLGAKGAMREKQRIGKVSPLGAEVAMREKRRIGIATNARGPIMGKRLGKIMGGGIGMLM